jgi:hypothetical protein
MLNKWDCERNHLNALYKNQTEFTIDEYVFSIVINYTIESNSGKIINGNLLLKEKMHNHLQYLLHMNLQLHVPPPEPETPESIRRKKRQVLGDDVV